MKHIRDPLGGHARLYWTLLDSPAYLALGFPARALYVDLRRKLGATNNGNIDATLSTLKHRGWRSSTTLSKALKELLAVGLIAQHRRNREVGFQAIGATTRTGSSFPARRGVPGADTILNNLQRFFPRGSRAATPPPPAP